MRRTAVLLGIRPAPRRPLAYSLPLPARNNLRLLRAVAEAAGLKWNRPALGDSPPQLAAMPKISNQEQASSSPPPCQLRQSGASRSLYLEKAAVPGRPLLNFCPS